MLTYPAMHVPFAEECSHTRFACLYHVACDPRTMPSPGASFFVERRNSLALRLRAALPMHGYCAPTVSALQSLHVYA